MSEDRYFPNPHLRDPSCLPDVSGEKGKAGQVWNMRKPYEISTH